MRRIAFAALVFGVAGAECTRAEAGPPGALAGPRTPVVVELFSSEGCSSCPPADTLLARFDRDQPVAGAEIIALEMHVDYWNQLGWRDPFSQAAFSARQRIHDYALGSHTYTPQMVIDGRQELVGSSSNAAARLIEQAARAPHLAVKLSRQGDVVSIEVPAAPASEGACQVRIATAERGLSTRVTAGENAGETLAHGPVVRSLGYVGALGPQGFRGQVTQPAKANTRAVVWVEARDTLHILGAAAL
jgi:hypothetical protein